jgi:hypothetical protein
MTARLQNCITERSDRLSDFQTFRLSDPLSHSPAEYRSLAEFNKYLTEKTRKTQKVF